MNKGAVVAHRICLDHYSKPQGCGAGT